MRDALDQAFVGGRLYRDLIEVTSSPEALDGAVAGDGATGHGWVVVVPFDEAPICARFARVDPVGGDWLVGQRPGGGGDGGAWWGPPPGTWRSSLDREAFVKGVRRVREAIAAGDVYQVNLCRTLEAPLGADADPWALAPILAQRNPARFASVIDMPSLGLWVASASPELFVSRSQDRVESGPIKGTSRTADGFLDKDRAENVMIVDLVRNDLGRVCVPGSVEVAALCQPEAHPGLWHLVSRIRGRLRPGVGWSELLAATFPPGSVSGAPKLATLDMITELEPARRSVYCGAIGWVDPGSGEGCLSVAIRTFWWRDSVLRFGTGGGITWGSEADGEWEETELKASRLVAAASGAGR